MTALIDNVHIVLPEIIILITACVALLCDLFLKHRFPSIAFVCVEAGLFLAACASVLFWGGFQATTLGGLFISDDLSQLMKLFVYLSVFLCFLYSKTYIDTRQIPSGDYYVLGLFSTLGMMVLISAHSLITLYLGLELLSLPLYALTTIRRTSKDGTEAAMKYFVMGAIASGMLLYGFSLLYGATGRLDLLDVANGIAANWHQQTALLSFSLVFILVGVCFKLAAVPFHMWVPDVYEGAPVCVTLFLSAGPKIAALGMLFRLLTIALPELNQQWQSLLVVMSLLSVAVGNLFAVSQLNIKRLLAYSAIAHMGYALFGVLAANSMGYAAALYYILVYALMAVAAFGLMTLLSKDGVEVDVIDDLRGLNKRNPWMAFMMLIIMFSMAGVPPTVGFFTKLLVLKALIDINFIWLAVLGLGFAVIGAYYYIRIVKVMYFDDCLDAKPFQLTRPMNLVMSLNSLSLLFLGIFPSALISLCADAFTH